MADSLNQYLQHPDVKSTIEVAEIGINKYGQICKIGFEVEFLKKDGGRFCFICVGPLNWGVKTYNFHPNKKRYTFYKS
jgi:hypothetical protein